MQTASARADEVLAGASLDNGDVEPRLRQLGREHQPRRTFSDDHYRMLGHSHTPAGSTLVATSASHPSATAATVPNFPAPPVTMTEALVKSMNPSSFQLGRSR